MPTFPQCFPKMFPLKGLKENLENYPTRFETPTPEARDWWEKFFQKIYLGRENIEIFFYCSRVNIKFFQKFLK